MNKNRNKKIRKNLTESELMYKKKKKKSNGL